MFCTRIYLEGVVAINPSLGREAKSLMMGYLLTFLWEAFHSNKQGYGQFQPNVFNKCAERYLYHCTLTFIGFFELASNKYLLTDMAYVSIRKNYATSRGVGRCQILEGHTFSWTRYLLKIFWGHRYCFLKIWGGAHAPMPPLFLRP